MSDTLNVTNSGQNHEQEGAVRKQAEVLLQERAAVVTEEGPQSVAVREIDLKLIELLDYCEKNQLRAVTKEELDRRVGESEQGFKNRVEAIRQAQRQRFWRQIEEKLTEDERVAAEQRLPQELEKARIRRRQENIEKRAQQEGLKELHLTPDEDPETCEIAYKGPVFRLIYPSVYTRKFGSSEGSGAKRKYAYNPFLLPTYILGKHHACFQEMAESGSDFMAGIRFDAVTGKFTVKAIDPKVTIRKHDRDAFAPFMQSTYELEEGDLVRLGPYQLSVERNHGYSMEALYTEAEFHAGEMLEIIFDTEKTTAAQKREAYQNLFKILDCNLSAGKLRNLREKIGVIHSGNLEKLWLTVKDRKEHSQVPDARMFVPLVTALKCIPEQKIKFDIPAGLDMDQLKIEAGRRFQDYAQLVVPGKINLPTPVLVETARFVEMGLLEMQDVFSTRTDFPHEYLERILELRRLIDALYQDEHRQLEDISQLLEQAQGLNLADVYGTDEIVMRNQDVEFNLYPDLPVVSGDGSGRNSYVAQIARKIAKHAWAKLQQKRTAEERKNELTLIKSLIDLGKVKPIHLVEFKEGENPLEKEREIEAKILEVEAGVDRSLRREEMKKQEQEQARRLAEKTMEKEYLTRKSIIERALDMLEKLRQSGQQADSADIYFLLKNWEAMMDPEALSVVEGCLEEIMEMPLERELADFEGRMTRITLQVAPVRKTWAEAVQEWRDVLDKHLPQLLKTGVAGRQSCLTMFLLKEAALTDHRWNDLLDANRRELEAAMELSQFRMIKKMVLMGKPDEEIWPDWLNSGDWSEYEELVDNIRVKLAKGWLESLIQRDKNSGADRSHRETAGKLLNAVPNLLYSLSKEQREFLF